MKYLLSIFFYLEKKKKSDLSFGALQSQMGHAGEEGGIPVWVANWLQQQANLESLYPLQPRGHMETLGRPVWCIPAHPSGESEREGRERKYRGQIHMK